MTDRALSQDPRLTGCGFPPHIERVLLALRTGRPESLTAWKVTAGELEDARQRGLAYHATSGWKLTDTGRAAASRAGW